MAGIVNWSELWKISIAGHRLRRQNEDPVKSWSEMHDIPPDKTDLLKEHLVEILKDNGDGKLCYRRRSKDALIWWQKDGEKSELR